MADQDGHQHQEDQYQDQESDWADAEESVGHHDEPAHSLLSGWTHRRRIRRRRNPGTEMDDSEEAIMNCAVCAEPLSGARALTEDDAKRRGCGCPICKYCAEQHVQTQVAQRQVYVECPLVECGTIYNESYIKRCLDEEQLRRYEQYKAEARNDPSVKTCIHCGEVHKLSIDEWKQAKQQQANADVGDQQQQQEQQQQEAEDTQLEVVCSRCGQAWCFRCHGPLHPGVPCSQFSSTKLDKKSNKWKRRHASKCPKCDTPIQRTEGCDRMGCLVCGTAFCYRCGAKIVGGNQGIHACEEDATPKGRVRRAAEYAVAGGVVAATLVVALPVCLAAGVVIGGVFGVALAASAASQGAKHATRKLRRRW